MRKRHARSLQEVASICYWPSLGGIVGGTLGFAAYKLTQDFWMSTFASENDSATARIWKGVGIPLIGLCALGGYLGHRSGCHGGRTVFDPYFTRALKA